MFAQPQTVNLTVLSLYMLYSLGRFLRQHPQSILFAYGAGSTLFWLTVGSYMEVRIGRLCMLLTLVPLLFSGTVPRPRIDRFSCCLGGFLLLAALATALSSASYVRGGVADWCVYVACGYAGVLALGEKAFKITAIGISIGIGAALCVSLTGYCLGLLPPPVQAHDLRLVLFTHSANRLALIATVPFIILISVAIQKQRYFPWPVQGLILVLAGGVLLWTASRGALLALGVTILLLIGKSLPLKKIGLVLLGALFCLAAASYAVPESSAHSFKRMFEFIANPLEDPSVRTRRPIWDAAVHTIQEHPLIGGGVGSFDAYFRQFKKEYKEELEKKYGRDGIEKIADHPHNLLLLLLAETGIAGTVLFIAFCALSMLRAMRLNPRLAVVPCSILCVYCLHAFFNSALYHKEAAAIVFSCFGFLLALVQPVPPKRPVPLQ